MSFDVDLHSFETDDVTATFCLVPWDSRIFGFPVAQIQTLAVRRPDAEAADFGPFERWRDAHGVRLVSCRLAHDRLRESMLIEGRGFRFVEMVCHPRLSPLRDRSFEPGEVAIARADDADLAVLEAIAGTAFTTGRYGLDWRLDPDLNGRRYRNWIRSSVADSQHVVLKALYGDAIIGFFDVEDRPDGGSYWHLTAIAPEWQGRGLGRRLWCTVLRKHQDEGREYVETTISAHNVAVLNLYAKLGFAFLPPKMTFHWLRTGEGAAGSQPTGRGEA
jgi:ribosomal protein S18 acetylase RimI-like enzyme